MCIWKIKLLYRTMKTLQIFQNIRINAYCKCYWKFYTSLLYADLYKYIFALWLRARIKANPFIIYIV